MAALYDIVGVNYAALSRPDPSIERVIHSALGDAVSVLNVGAGCWSYEPLDRPVVAVELSGTMIRQRPADAAPVVQATAMALPFGADAFDASMAILSVHHWQDKVRGLEELSRVSRGRVDTDQLYPESSAIWFDHVAEYSPGHGWREDVGIAASAMPSRL